MRRVLVTAQVAVSVVVLSTGSLFVRNLLLARATHPGFDVRNTLRAEVHLPPVRYRDEALQKAYFTEALRELEAIPGMEAAAAARILPFIEESHERVDLTFSHTGLTPMPRPSDNRALKTKPGLRDRERTAYCRSRQTFSKKRNRHGSKACSLMTATLPGRSGCHGRRPSRVECQLGFEVLGKRPPAQNF